MNDKSKALWKEICRDWLNGIPEPRAGELVKLLLDWKDAEIASAPTPNLERGHCVIAVSPNSWGRGETTAEALKNLVKAGGTRSKAQLRFVSGDAKAYVSDMGDLMVNNGAISYKI